MALRIGFCGAGSMGKAIIKGILSAGLTTSDSIVAFDAYQPVLDELVKELGIKGVSNEAEVARHADIIILAVKPGIIPEVLGKIQGALSAESIVVSIAAGVTLARLEANLQAGTKVVRVMPNTPALVGEGMSALSPNAHLSEHDKKSVLAIFSSFGKAEFVGEYLMDSVVGLSGSGPAYVYMFIEALADGAVLCGMPRNSAYTFAAQTVLGAAKMVLETGMHPGALKDMVCSPGGTTIEAVKVLEEHGLRNAVINAVKASADKNALL